MFYYIINHHYCQFFNAILAAILNSDIGPQPSMYVRKITLNNLKDNLNLKQAYFFNCTLQVNMFFASKVLYQKGRDS